MLAQLDGFKFRKLLHIFIWPVDRTVTGTNTPV